MDTNAILERLRASGIYDGSDDEAVAAYEDFIANVFLKGTARHLRAPATLENIIDLKVNYMDMHLHDRLLRLRGHGVGEKDAQKALGDYREIMEQLVTYISEHSPHPFRAVFSDLDETTLADLEAGKLTLGELIERKPDLIFEGPL